MPSNNSTVLRCEGLTRTFGDRIAVDNVSFEIVRGETYGLLGPNGSGKTTTISMLAGILTPTSGTVELAGKPLTPTSTEAKRAIGLVPQEIALYQDLTAAENLRFFGRLQGLRGRELQRRIDRALTIVGLEDRPDERVDQFSGGMKRRVNIAAGMLHEPQLIVLDEPTVGVDPQSRNQILDSIEALGGEGVSVLYTTHYMEEAERLCDRVGILDNGRLIAEGTQKELVRRVGEGDLIIVGSAMSQPGADQPGADQPGADQPGADQPGADQTNADQLGVDQSDNGMLDHGLLAALRSLPGVGRVDVTGRGIEVSTNDARVTLGPLVAAFTSANVPIDGLQLREPNLEAVFLHLTGRALRDS